MYVRIIPSPLQHYLILIKATRVCMKPFDLVQSHLILFLAKLIQTDDFKMNLDYQNVTRRNKMSPLIGMYFDQN